MGVPYADAWDMPADMALDMLGLSTNTAKSKQPNNTEPLPKTLVNQHPKPTVTVPRKQVAARRKSQLDKSSTI